MARTVSDIQQTIIAEKNAQSALVGLNSPSKSAIWLVWTYVVAVCIALHEQLWDIFKAEIEDIALKAVPGTAEWWQDQIFKFQYSATTPQVVGLVAFAPTYPVVNPALRIITRCSVGKINILVIGIKVAKGVYPSLSALGTAEVNALKSYVDRIQFAGTQVNVVSLDADRARISAQIFYEGQYVVNSVKVAVINAINVFLATIPFDGILYATKLLNAIQAVSGVKDIILSEVKARANTETLASATVVNRYYETKAGYIIAEDTALNTLDDTISMILSPT